MNSFSPSIFGRLFSNGVVVTFDDRGVVINDKKSMYKITWSELTTPVHFEFGFLGQNIRFSTIHKKYKLSMRAYASEYLLKDRCEQYWVDANKPKLNDVLHKVAQVVGHQFLRQSNIRKIHSLSKQEYKRWFPWVKNSKSYHVVENEMLLLNQYAMWNDTLTQLFQEKYISWQLLKHKAFFDSVESNPLTYQQRRACVIDNDNNLLLAGAGTGKTSVMVGRAGFLVESGQAKYKEILLLAYGNKAANEMDERIQKKLHTDQIQATTFHRLGLNIIAKVENSKPTISPLATNEKEKTSWIYQCVESLMTNNEEYQHLILIYLGQYYYVEKSHDDFDTLEDYHHYLNCNDVLSIKNDKVRNFVDLYTANWLFYHGLDYQYKSTYKVNINTPQGKPYTPSFYLPEYDIYIDSIEAQSPNIYNTDNSNTQISEQDRKHVEWLESLHETNHTQCITLTYSKYNQAALFLMLERKLMAHHILLKHLSFDDIYIKLLTMDKFKVLSKQFSQLLNVYKEEQLTSSSWLVNKESVKESIENKNVTHALLQPILSAYNDYLRTNNEIDFEDMIAKAIDYVKTGQFISPWRYIMVDEFQDISLPRAKLVKTLHNSYKESTVFAVGDDWQSIYRFSGADIRLTTKFKDYFGFTTQTTLDVTFRFNNKIGDVAANFISKNPIQLSKSMNSLVQVVKPAVSIFDITKHYAKRDNKNSSMVTELLNGSIDATLQAINCRVEQPTSVYLLARFWFKLPTQIEIERLNNQYPLLQIEAQSIHAAKGKEADYVILIGLQKGKQGFPAEKTMPAIFDVWLPKEDTFAFGEERRLFYVALTRAKYRVYLLADLTKKSPFVHELITDENVELNEFNDVLVEKHSVEA